MVLKHIGVFSAAKIAGFLYALIGLIFGALFSVVSILGAAGGALQGQNEEAVLGFLFGAGAIIILPVFYGIMGFIGAAISAAIYNLAAGWMGGIELDIS